MTSRPRHLLPVGIAAAALAVTALPATPAVAASNASAAHKGAGWLVRNAPVGGDGTAADTLVALRAGGRLSTADARRRAAALRRGARSYPTTAGGYGKIALALVAARSGNPRCAAGVDLVAGINRGRSGGRYRGNIYDQTIAMTALSVMRVGPPRAAVRTLLRARGRGGWNLAMTRSGGRDSVTSTAAAILALRGAGVSSRNGTLRSAYAWILSQRTPGGGYTEDGNRGQANPTALAIRAGRAMGRRDTRAEGALRSLQQGDGAFLYTRADAGSRLLATTDAVLALSGRTQPVARLAARPGRC